MNNLSNTAKKLDKVFEIAHIVLGALAIACIVGVALIAVAYLFKMDPDMIGTDYENFDIGFLELTVAEGYAPEKWLVLLQAAITLAVTCRLMYDGRRGVGYIREILHPMTEEKPFDTIVSTNLKKLARLSINLGILYNALLLTEQGKKAAAAVNEKARMAVERAGIGLDDHQREIFYQVLATISRNLHTICRDGLQKKEA